MITRRDALVGAGLATLAVAGCSDGADPDTGAITIGYMPSWTDSVVMAFVLQDRLQALGAEVDLTAVDTTAVAFVALDEGDIDIFSSTWPDATHAPFFERYQDDLEDLGTYGDFARTMLAVPEYTRIDSLEELAEVPERFDGTVYGIEPGAGLNVTVNEDVLPAYGLERAFELVSSSTPAMLSELKKSATATQDVLVTLWTPHRVEDTVSTKALDDPLGAFENPETLHVTGRGGFTEDFPRAADYIGRVQLAEEEYTELENLLVDEYPDDEAEGVARWIEENPGVLPGAATD